MAKITITIEDLPGGTVKVEANPKPSALMGALVNGHELTSAEGYALSALNHIKAQSDLQKSGLVIPVPRGKWS